MNCWLLTAGSGYQGKPRYLGVPEKSGKLDFFNPLKALYRAVTAIHGKSQKIKLLLFASFWQSMNCLLRMVCSSCRYKVAYMSKNFYKY